MTDIRNFESLSDDTVQCLYYSSAIKNNYTFWEELCESLNVTISTLSKDYIWHRDEFKVYMPIPSDGHSDRPDHLISTTCFGDNIEDEWFIVYLLLELTKQYQDVIVQIKDNDGDFLLIEAADCLPKWANPDSTENRVFIHQGTVHIIPPSIIDINMELKLKNAIEVVVERADQTRAPEVHQAILKRIGSYPDKIKESLHRAIVKLPIDLAALLTLQPSLISPIVIAYCNHDVIDAKHCKNVEFVDCLNVEVKFTKCLYAMLIHSKMMKTNKFGKTNEHDKKTILGLKLTCGYTMIMSKLSQDIFSTKQYNKFVKSLEANGYFRGNIEGSKDYKKLLEKANDFFLNIECPISSHVSNSISQLMTTNKFIEMKNKLLKNRSVTESNLEEDDEGWLNIHPQQLNDFLNERYGKQSKFKNNDIITPHSLTSELSNFLKQSSDFEGIESNDVKDLAENIEFDSDQFVNSLKNMLNIITSDGDGSDFSDNFGDDDDDMEMEETEIDKELGSMLQSKENNDPRSSGAIIQNMLQSIKEEQGSSGPSSNLFRTIGIQKTDLLDSDDDLTP